jgi:hypothetical protein
MTTNEQKFCKMMAPNINCWMSNYYLALDYVADLVITGKITIEQDSDCEELAKPFLTDEYDLDAVENLLFCFKMFAFEDSSEIGNAFGIEQDDLDSADLSLWEFIDLFSGNPKKTAELLLQAKKSYIPTYSAGA